MINIGNSWGNLKLSATILISICRYIPGKNPRWETQNENYMLITVARILKWMEK